VVEIERRTKEVVRKSTVVRYAWIAVGEINSWKG
jgi:hypothetical protein